MTIDNPDTLTREQVADHLRKVWESGQDPLLDALTEARRRRDQATQQLRTLIALGREFTAPRPYPLKELAAAAGLSPSGVRICYGLREIAYLQHILTCNATVPDYLRAPILALRHQPNRNLDQVPASENHEHT